jgi:hypothetical protein
VRRFTKWSALASLAVVVAFAGCKDNTPPRNEAMTADLERDLNLVSSAKPKSMQIVSALEQGPLGAPSGRNKGRRAPIRTPKGVPEADPTATEQEVVPTNLAGNSPAPVVGVSVTQTAPSSGPSVIVEPSIPSAEPEPGIVPGSQIPTEDGGIGSNHGRINGGAIRGIIGGAIGVIIRGGMVGDDHCKPRGADRGIGAIGGMGAVRPFGGEMPGRQVGRGSPYPRY